MARPRLLDMMQVYPFWLFDASGASGNALFSIFDPSLGFSQISAPEITVETKQFRPGNWEYQKTVVKGAGVSPITLSRGARFYDSDFYNWITNAILGRQPVRRTLVLVHFLGFRAQAQSSGADQSFPDNAQIQLGLRTPGRAWVLQNCVPTRYKAGSDFDATAGDVSIQELEVQPEFVMEMTLATLSPATARAIGAGLDVVNAAI